MHGYMDICNNSQWFAGSAIVLWLISWMPRNLAALMYVHSDAASFALWCFKCVCVGKLIFVPLSNLVVREV